MKKLTLEFKVIRQWEIDAKPRAQTETPLQSCSMLLRKVSRVRNSWIFKTNLYSKRDHLINTDLNFRKPILLPWSVANKEEQHNDEKYNCLDLEMIIWSNWSNYSTMRSHNFVHNSVHINRWFRQLGIRDQFPLLWILTSLEYKTFL